MDKKIKEEVVFDIIHCLRPQLIIRKFSVFYIKKTFIITAWGYYYELFLCSKEQMIWANN